jgi:hypothetical protein
VGVVLQTSEAGGNDAIHPFADAFMTTGMPMLITDARQSDNPIAYANLIVQFTHPAFSQRFQCLSRCRRQLRPRRG